MRKTKWDRPWKGSDPDSGNLFDIPIIRVDGFTLYPDRAEGEWPKTLDATEAFIINTYENPGGIRIHRSEETPTWIGATVEFQYVGAPFYRIAEQDPLKCVLKLERIDRKPKEES